MKSGREIRKYGTPARILAYVRYGIHQGVVLPVKIAMVSAAVILGCITCIFGIGLLADLAVPLDMLLTWVLFLVCLSATAALLRLTVYMLVHVPKGHILNPMPPRENPLLPDKELLVRAADSTSAQPQELLRATQATCAAPPEELLRAGRGEG
jgi:hypothetical protein